MSFSRNLEKIKLARTLKRKAIFNQIREECLKNNGICEDCKYIDCTKEKIINF